jgi:hypothetical protein
MGPRFRGDDKCNDAVITLLNRNARRAAGVCVFEAPVIYRR